MFKAIWLLTSVVLLAVASLMVQALAASSMNLRLDGVAVARVTVLRGDGKPRSKDLLPGSPGFVQLQAWLAHNRVGWSTYLATTQGRGVLVDAGDLRLQFVGTTVFACPKGHGCSSKPVQEADYAFLLD